MKNRNVLRWLVILLISLTLAWGYQPAFAQTDSHQQSDKLIKRDGYSLATNLSGYISANTNQLQEGCTIGVAAGKATADGRPLLWKTRDYAPKPNNEVYYNTSYKYNFVSVINAGGTYAWMGVNEKGFAILNSLSKDLPQGSSGPTNGALMRFALGTCATVADFEHLLDSTNVTGRKTQANFGVIDTTGAAAIFETGGNVYWKFDANNSIVAPNGYVLRTNFAMNGGGSGGIERYRRTVKLIGDFYAGDSLNYRSIIRYQMRDFSDYNSNPVPVPYPHKWRSDRPFGYIYTGVSICRSSSVSAAVIQGVLPGEPAKLSTLWAMLGQPASTITVPYWPVGKTPPEADGSYTAPLCDIANQIKTLLFDYTPNTNYIDSYKLRDGMGCGLWVRTFPAEDLIFAAAEEKLAQWRTTTPTAQEMLDTEKALAHYTLSILQQAYDGLVTSIATNIAETTPTNFALSQNYPNPFNPNTTIQFSLPRSCYVTLKVFNLSGKEVTTLVSQEFTAGKYTTQWNATGVASGVYFYRLQARSIDGGQTGDFVETKRLTVVR